MSKKALYVLIGIGFLLMCVVLYGAISLMIAGSNMSSNSKPSGDYEAIINQDGSGALASGTGFDEVKIGKIIGGTVLVQNNTKKYAITIPADWIIPEGAPSDGELKFVYLLPEHARTSADADAMLSIQVFKNAQNLSVDEWLNTNDGQMWFSDVAMNKLQATSVGGFAGYKQIVGTSASTYAQYFLAKNNFVYTILTYAHGAKKNDLFTAAESYVKSFQILP